MRYSPSTYAKYLLTLNTLPHAEQKSAIKKFAEFLTKNGDIKDWQKIGDIYEVLKEKSAKKKKAKVSYAGHIKKTEIENHLKDYEVEFYENKNLIGGIQIKIGDVRIDNTIAGRLKEINKALVK